MEAEEEFITNKLMKRLEQLKKEKQILANEVRGLLARQQQMLPHPTRGILLRLCSQHTPTQQLLLLLLFHHCRLRLRRSSSQTHCRRSWKRCVLLHVPQLCQQRQQTASVLILLPSVSSTASHAWWCH